jgi:hypothetical protein
MRINYTVLNDPEYSKERVRNIEIVVNLERECLYAQ